MFKNKKILVSQVPQNKTKSLIGKIKAKQELFSSLSSAKWYEICRERKKRFLESVIERKQICIENKKTQKQENWIKHDLDVKQVKDLTLEFSVDDENKQKKR